VFVALLTLAGTRTRVIGLVLAAIPVGVFLASLPFTRNAVRTRTLNVGRAVVYHLGLLLVLVGPRPRR
jgi:hypothetical protein